MKILLVTETLVAGGAETFALRLARSLCALGHRCDLLCLNSDLQEPGVLANYPDLRILHVPLPALRWLKRADRMLVWMGLEVSLQRLLTGRWLRKSLIGRYDVYHTNLIGADRLFAELKKEVPELPLISTLHGDYGIHEHGESSAGERNRIPHWERVAADLVQAVDMFVYISDDQRQLMTERLHVGPSKLRRIYNGYEPPAPLLGKVAKQLRAPTTFIMVARGLPEKGWSTLIEAFQSLRGECRLLLVGRGEHLDELASQHGSDPRIDFKGFHPNPAELIKDAEVFVFPSLYAAESLPTVVTEALYCGVPVIATDVGEVGRMLRNQRGETAGILIDRAPAGTIVHRLSQAMQQYLDEPDLLRQHAALTSSAFLKFDMRSCAEAYVAAYAEVTARPRGPLQPG